MRCAIKTCKHNINVTDADKFEQTITLEHVLLRRESQPY